MFEVGQEVVCIKDDWGWPFKDHPVKGCVYKIKSIRPAQDFCARCIDTAFLYFKEFGDYGYAQSYFRPVKKTNISIFTAMLNTNKQKEPA